MGLTETLIEFEVSETFYGRDTLKKPLVFQGGYLENRSGIADFYHTTFLTFYNNVVELASKRLSMPKEECVRMIHRRGVGGCGGSGENIRGEECSFAEYDAEQGDGGKGGFGRLWHSFSRCFGADCVSSGRFAKHALLA